MRNPKAEQTMKCRICGNDENGQIFNVGEMMFGTRENFPYFECSRCGCLQISQVPENMSKYYLQDYYLSSQPKPKRTIRGFLRRAMLRMPFLFHGKILGRYTSALFRYSFLYYCSSKTHFNLNSRVLEVGCGKGSLLRVLHDLGYRNLVGVDPYSYEGMVNNGIKILKRTIHDLPDTQMFDIIIFDHSFEHIFDQLETLKKTSKIMSDNSVCLIRMPVKTEYIWKRYSTSWVQIDAPRHFFLHTLKSIRLLAEEAGLSIEKTVFDSTEFQFWGSELRHEEWHGFTQSEIWRRIRQEMGKTPPSTKLSILSSFIFSPGTGLVIALTMNEPSIVYIYPLVRLYYAKGLLKGG